MRITIATYVTILRILLTPFIMVAILAKSWGIALLLFLSASLTDLLDGYLARRYNQESRLGSLLDPVADKILLIFGMVAMLYHITDSFIRYAFVFFMCKEILLLSGGYFLYSCFDIFIKPSRLSRLASLFEFILFFILIICYNFPCLIDIRIIRVITILFCLPSVLLLVRYGIYTIQLMRKKI